MVGCITSQQHASVSQGRICLDKFACCHTETEVADQALYLTHLRYTDTGPNSPSADPITQGPWQSSHWRVNFQVTGMTRPGKIPRRKRKSNPRSSAFEAPQLPGQRGGLNPGDQNQNRLSQGNESVFVVVVLLCFFSL